jgi:hypothetical protein
VVVAAGGSLERSRPSARDGVAERQTNAIPTQVNVCAESRTNEREAGLKGIKVSANLRQKWQLPCDDCLSTDDFQHSIIQAAGYNKPYAARIYHSNG